MVLIPSPNRTYVVPASIPNVGAGYYAPNNLTVATKSSADILDYSFDFTTWLSGTADTLTDKVSIITSGAITAYPVVLVSSSVSGNIVTCMLGSGQPGTVNTLGLQVVTTQGRTAVIPFTMTIDSTSSATTPTPDPTPTPTPTPSDTVGISSITSTQTDAAAGEVVTMTLTFTMTDKSTQEVEVELSPGAAGLGVSSIKATANPENAALVDLVFTMTDKSTQTVSVPVVQGEDGVGLKSIALGTTTVEDSAAIVFTLTDGSTETVLVPVVSGQDGVGISKVTTAQGTVVAGQTSIATLTFAKTDGTTDEVEISVPAGAAGSSSGGGGSGTSGVPLPLVTLTGGDVTITPDALGRPTDVVITVNAAGALTLGATTATGIRQKIHVKIIQTGAFAFTLPDSTQKVSYPNGTVFTVPQMASVMYVTYVTYDGTNWAAYQAP